MVLRTTNIALYDFQSGAFFSFFPGLEFFRVFTMRLLLVCGLSAFKLGNAARIQIRERYPSERDARIEQKTV